MPGCKYAYVSVPVNIFMRVCMYTYMDGWMDGWTDGWMDGCLLICRFVGLYASMSVYNYTCIHMVQSHKMDSLLKFIFSNPNGLLTCNSMYPQR